MVKLSVVVVNYNGCELVAECLASLAAQTLPDVEVLVVDNASSDDSVALVRREFPQFGVIRLERNYGFAGGSNRGIAASRGEFVALLNNDAVADPPWAERLVAAAADSSVGMAASRVLLYSDRGRLDSAGDGMTTVGVAFKRGHLAPADRFARSEKVFGASGCAMLLRRAMLDDVGLFDEDFFLIYEDADLAFRAQLRGWGCVYVPGAVVYHRLNASIGSLSATYVYYGQRNVEYVYFKDMPSRLLWTSLPAHLLNDALAAAYFACRGRFGSFVRAKLDVLRALRPLRAKRRAIQARARVGWSDIERQLERRWLRTRLTGK